MNRLNQILNVSQKEWPRIILAWSLIFLTRMGFIVGWTILIASFLTRIGINLLPLLFLGNALLVMTGTLIYRRLLHKVRREVLITYTTISAASFLIAAAALMGSSNALFFSFFLIAQGIFISQLSILISIFNESLFSPIEGQRVFPIIESAETIGGIVSGLILSLGSHTLPPYKFILMGVLLLFMLVPIIFKYNSKTMEIPQVGTPSSHPSKKLKESFRELKKIPFVKGLMVIILLNWGIMNMVEFQSMKALQQNEYSTEEKTLVQSDEQDQVVLAEENTHEEDLTQKLGMLHLIFYSAALFIQLIVASRILKTLGTVPTMMLHPIVTILNVVGMSFHFNFITASLTRGSYELTNILFRSAHDSSRYAIEHSLQEDAQELLQGVIRPLGAIIGTISMILIAFVLEGLPETLAINAMILVGSTSILITLKSLGSKYSDMCEQNLSHKKDLPTRINAVEILGQKGHEKKFPALEKLLKRPQEPLILKESILNTLGERQDLESISVILDMLNHHEESLRQNAIVALGHFEDLKIHLMQQAFTKHRVISVLKEVLLKEKNPSIREEAVQCFFRIAPEELTSFILNTIDSHAEKKADFIKILRLFPDPNLSHYLTPYLQDPSMEVRGAALIALWQFPTLQKSLQHHLLQMLSSKKTETLKIGLNTTGAVRFKGAKAEVRAALQNPDPEIQEKALLALAQLEENSILPRFVENMTDPLHEWFKNSSSIVAELPKRFQEEVKYLFHIRLVEDINKLLKQNKKVSLNRWERTALERLKTLYSKLNAHHEAYHLQKLLDSSDSNSL